MSTYKIRNQEGLYSRGGGHGSFTRDGKVWSTLGALKCHLAHYRTYYGQERSIPEDWEVVEFVEGPVVAKAKDLKPKGK